MFLKDAEELVKQWFIGDAKVFYYYNYWAWRQQETIILHKKYDDTFTTIKDKSTVKPDDFTADEVIKMLCNGLLVERVGDSVNRNYRDEKTGGCICGVWATSATNIPESHWPDCPRRHGRRY